MTTVHARRPSNATSGSQLRLETKRLASQRLRAHAARAFLRLTVLLVVDMAFASAAFWVAVTLRETLVSPLPFLAGVAVGRGQFNSGLLFGLVLFGAYRSGDRWRAWPPLFHASALGTALALWKTLWLAPPAAIGQGVVLLCVVGVALSIGRSTVSFVVGRWWDRTERREGVLLVGPEDAVETAASGLLFRSPSPFRVEAVLPIEDDTAAGDFATDLLSSASACGVGTVVTAGQIPLEPWHRLIELADVGGWRVLSLATTSGPHFAALRQLSVGGIPITEVTTPHLDFHQLVLKRLLDLVLSGLLLITLAPLFLAIAVLVLLTSPGPVLFAQDRVGLGGRVFRILKFRSMIPDAETRLDSLRAESVYSDGRLFKLKKDPRVTPVGALLRRTSLDELPQLFNVFKGEMSLVGPRPPTPNEVVLYEAHHYCRFDVKPGMTGPWQVAGRNQITDFEEVILIEREYIRNWSLVRDLRILLETIPAVVTGRGAS